MSSKRLGGQVFESAEAVRDYVAPLRAQGRTLVTTNGCFDVIHRGHIECLRECKALGDLLVVGINGDASVQRLKGPGRPLQGEQDRALIVASLRMVDAAFIFHEDDPRRFIEILRPDIHAKGGDYSRAMIETPVVERCGGKVVIVPLVQGVSTSSIVANAVERGT